MLEIELYHPHSGQQPMHDSNARFRIASCGRRFGKTYMAINEIVKFANENPQINTIWVAPTYRQSKLAYSLIVNNFDKAFRGHTKSPMEIMWLNGSVTKFLSTESKDNLRGDNAHLIVCDEAAMIDNDVWSNILRPMLSDTQGKAIIISTPRGINNWFHQLFMRGLDGEYKDYESFRFPTSANPFIPAHEIEEVRTSLPESVFKQEYLAEFLEDGGTVFRNVDSCIKDMPHTIDPSKTYVIGYDVAKHQDFSVICVIDTSTNHVVELDRFNRMEYALQVKRLEATARKYNNAHILVDSTGVGDPILESIKRLGLVAEGFVFTNKSKQQLIEHLAVQLEQMEISYPNLPVLINELKSYQYELTRAGSMTYNAPSGLHDDCVIALALATWYLKHIRNPRVIML